MDAIIFDFLRVVASGRQLTTGGQLILTRKPVPGERTSQLLPFVFSLLEPLLFNYAVAAGHFFIPCLDWSVKPMGAKRTDRTPGNRGAFENAKKKILATQTICGICGKPVDFSYKNPHPLAPTVDHIIPVAKGGHPSDINNLQLAHRCCNRQKSDKLFVEGKREVVEDKIVPNNQLELHADWLAYRST